LLLSTIRGAKAPNNPTMPHIFFILLNFEYLASTKALLIPNV